jgi:hypothetical protein
MTAVITPSAARSPEYPGPRWSFGSATAEQDRLPRPVINRVPMVVARDRCYDPPHGLKNRSLKRKPSHGRRPHAKIPPHSTARLSGIRP